MLQLATAVKAGLTAEVLLVHMVLPLVLPLVLVRMGMPRMVKPLTFLAISCLLNNVVLLVVVVAAVVVVCTMLLEATVAGPILGLTQTISSTISSLRGWGGGACR
jgi:hypothetical protein